MGACAAQNKQSSVPTHICDPRSFQEYHGHIERAASGSGFAYVKSAERYNVLILISLVAQLRISCPHSFDFVSPPIPHHQFGMVKFHIRKPLRTLKS